MIAAAVIWAGAWIFTSGGVPRAADFAQGKLIALTAKAGFTVDEILVEGRENTDAEVLKALLNVDRGDPIFLFDPVEAKDLIERVSWVKKAHVERRLPDTIFIGITERKPLALWQNKKKIRLIDAEGVTLADRNLDKFSGLLIITGEKAPAHAGALIALIAAQPFLKDRVDAASWVGGRRWDIVLEGGLTIKLPEKDAEIALQKLAAAQDKDAILNKAIETIDLREDDRIIVQPSGGGTAQVYNAGVPGGNI